MSLSDKRVIVILLLILIIAAIYINITKEPFYEENSFRIPSSRLEVRSTKADHSVVPYSQKIPFKIHQTYYSRDLELDIYQTCMTIKNMNPEYNYYFYTDKDCREYIQREYPPEYLKAYDMVIPGAYKADVFRYLLLYREGGVYMDCKSSTMVALRDFIPKTTTFAVFRDRPEGALLNSFMAVTPGHPIMKKVIDMTISNILQQKYNNNSLDITGPQTLGRAFNITINRPELKDITPGVYGENKDFVVLGSFYVFGEGEKEFDALVDENKIPLVAKTLKNYYNNPNRIDYHALWRDRRVFKI